MSWATVLEVLPVLVLIFAGALLTFATVVVLLEHLADRDGDL